MFKIGDFSKFTRVSVKMLRHYDHLGLLKPARIDPATNYRYYSADQLPRLNRLLALRELGLTLEQIGPLLPANGAGLPVEQMRGMLRLKQAELAQHLRDEQRRLDAIQARLDQIEREGQGADVVVRRIAPQLMARLRDVVGDSDDTHLLFEEVERHVAQHGARASAPPLAIFYDGEYREADVDMEVAIPLRAAIPSTPRIQVGELPGGETLWVACLVHTGSYDTIGAASEALLAWIEAHGYQIAGPVREVYLRFNAAGLEVELPAAYLAPRAEDFVTELQLPVVSA